jgi:hypothetical protein
MLEGRKPNHLDDYETLRGAKLEPMIQFFVSIQNEATRCRASLDE